METHNPELKTWDLLIRGATVVDGGGGSPIQADVAIKDGLIAAVGELDGTATKQLDATGLILTPGFVDVHTHYDGQATWDDCMTPSSWHGVTTAVMGNCGVGFAPCKPEDQGRLVKLMEGVEDIPGVVLTEGLSWDWQSFPDFMEAVEARPHDIDLAAQLPHGPLRVYVMGERAERLEEASPDDIEKMAAITRDAIKAGALGFSTSRTLNHRTSEGKPTPSLKASEDELMGIAMALSDVGAGVLQFVTDFKNAPEEMAMLQRLSAESGRPLSVSLAQADRAPQNWQRVLSWIDQAQAAGQKIVAQVAGRPVGLLLGFSTTLNPFLACPSYRPLRKLDKASRLAALHISEVRQKILAEYEQVDLSSPAHFYAHLNKTFMLGENPDYEQTEQQSIAALARHAGTSAAAFAYDLMLQNDGERLLYLPFLNYSEGSLDASLAMMKHPHTILGLGDGGAHLGSICDASFTTHMLSFWTRDRHRGEKLSVQTVVKMHSFDTAQALGLLDRGLIKPGYKADINLIDYEALRLFEPNLVQDLPAGGTRLMQKAAGYRYTLVSGEVTYRDGEWTGATPGKLIRGAQAVPKQQDLKGEI